MKFEWATITGIYPTLAMRHSLFSCTIIKLEGKYKASIEIGSGAGFLGIGGLSVGSSSFDDEETAKTACENTIIGFCKAIVEAAGLEQK